MTEAQRKELNESHRELDYSVISDSAHAFVLSSLHGVRTYFTGIPIVKEDDLRMIIRVLEYAKYIDISVGKLLMQ
jgi:hypothetical protein